MRKQNISNIVPMSTVSALSTIQRDIALGEYVEACRAEAIASASRQGWVNAEFGDIVSGLEPLVSIDEARPVAYTIGDVVNVREQSFTYACWLTVLMPLMVSGYTNTQLIDRQLAESFQQWDDVTRAKWVKKIMARMAKAGLVETKTVDGNMQVVVEFVGPQRYPRVSLSQEYQDRFESWAVANSGIKLLPLDVRPIDWDGMFDGVAPELGLKLVPKAINKPEIGRKSLQGINAMQRTAFVVNDDIKDIVQEYLDNIHRFAFKSVGAKDADVRLCRRIMSMKSGKKYWLPVTLDNRGRMYYRGGELTPQGKDLAKAAFMFADPVALGNTGLEALQIVLANAWGIKGSIDARVQWVEAEFADLVTMSWFDIKKVADEPFQAYALIREIDRVWSLPIARQKFYASAIVCHMDGSQNGYQHQAAIIGDRSTAMNTNLLEATLTDTPYDAYMAVLTAVIENVKLPVKLRELARLIGRNLVKQPTMTTQYNATVGTFAKHMRTEFGAAFDEAGVSYWDMAKACAEAVDTVLPAARTLINVYRDRFSKVVKDAFGNTETVYIGPEIISWTLPDGFQVKMSYRSSEWRTIRAGRSAIVLPLEDGETDPLDGGKMLRALAANFIQSLDGCHMRMIAASCAFPIIGIHDSVGCHAGHFFKVGQVVRDTFIELHKHDVLNQMLRENSMRSCSFFDKDYTAAESSDAIYMFS